MGSLQKWYVGRNLNLGERWLSSSGVRLTLVHVYSSLFYEVGDDDGGKGSQFVLSN